MMVYFGGKDELIYFGSIAVMNLCLKLTVINEFECDANVHE